MRDIEIALSRLDNVKPVAGGYQARCPCHEDKVASLSVAEKEGKFLAYCHAGCKFENIVKALDLRPDRNNDTPAITDTYDYTDKEGTLLYQVVRYFPKAFKQRRPDGVGGWIWDLKGITPTLYHLPEVVQAVAAHKLIWVVEGEKDADNLRKQGQIATTISGGASTKWPPYLVPMLDSAMCCIIPDNDEPGRKYAHYVGNLIYGIAASVKILNIPNSKDVSDYLKTQSIDSLLELYHNSDMYIPSGVVTRDEFNELRGLNLYLLRELKERKESNIKKRKKYTIYDN